ncbi:MAG: Rpn family recombination-promoting nuclease/putative transposase [Ruminococcus sp.]|nr:Rpn family recombination-promoting nuclease/putative transposase [Ruminococcus sp.]
MVCSPQKEEMSDDFDTDGYGGVITREEMLEKIPEFRLMDDIYMTVFFNGHPELIEFVLNIILKRDDLHVTDSKIQMPLKNIQGHSAILDIYAVDDKGTRYNIEVQSRSDGAHPKRARYYSSLIDGNSLVTDEEYDELPETYVIFFTSADYFGKGLSLYTVNRKVEELDVHFGDDSHIVYVNGSYKGDDLIGKLVHDFKCKKPSEMFLQPLADRAHTIKETNGGNDDMCQIMEDMNRKVAAKAEAFGIKKHARLTAVNMLKRKKYSFDEISELNGISLEEVKKLAADMERQAAAKA